MPEDDTEPGVFWEFMQLGVGFELTLPCPTCSTPVPGIFHAAEHDDHGELRVLHTHCECGVHYEFRLRIPKVEDFNGGERIRGDDRRWASAQIEMTSTDPAIYMFRPTRPDDTASVVRIYWNPISAG